MLLDLIRTAQIQDIIISERMKVYEASFSFTIENAPEYGFFINIIKDIAERDEIKITLQDESENFFKISLEVREREYQNFLKNIFIDEVISVKIRINKKVKNNYFSIYEFDEFTKDILLLSMEDVMSAFSSLLKETSGLLIFDIYSPVSMFTTETMFFIPHGNEITTLNFNRKQRLENCKEVSNFYNFDIYEILPDDFKIKINYRENPLTDLFQKIMGLLSISFIATSSNMIDKQLKVIIDGQRRAEYCCNIGDVFNNEVLYTIYNWIYTEGNAIDKAIIARNVISLHCKQSLITEIDEKVIDFIQSNYNLYLKNNVTQYLELKNKVAEFISNTVSKTGEYATVLLNKFKSNLIAIFGFIFTVVLTNVVSNQPLENLFTKEITMLLELILAGSFVYLFICYFQSKYEIRKVYDSYEQLKEFYKDILTEDDVLEIFKNDDILNKMKVTINKSTKIYFSVWIFFLLISLFSIEYISDNPILLEFLRILGN